MRRMSALLLSAATALAVLSAVPAPSFAADHTPIHNFQAQQNQKNVAALDQSEQTSGCRPQYEFLWSHVERLNNCVPAAPAQGVQP